MARQINIPGYGWVDIRDTQQIGIPGGAWIDAREAVAAAADEFFENRHPIEHGMKPITAAGMQGVLVE